MTQQPWTNRVFIVPAEVLKVQKAGGSAPMHILNNGPTRLAYKLKSIRSQSLKPSVSNGFLAANGGCAQIVFVWKPQPNEKPLNVSDRLTILMTKAAEGVMNWDMCAGGNEGQCRRFVVELRHVDADSSTESEQSTTETKTDDSSDE